MPYLRHAVSSCLLIALFTLPTFGKDWSRFRGANGHGISASGAVPTEFGPDKNELWEVAVPFGRSSPVVAGGRIYLTATEEDAFVTLAIEAKTGEILWKSSVERMREEEHHHDTDSATTTPVTDGKHVYAFFQEFGIVSYDKRGKERWRHSMGPFRNFYGIAASPVLSGNLLYMLCDQAEGSFLVAIDKNTGGQVWRRNRPARLESYTTPILYPDERRPKALLIYGSGWVDAYELKTGKTLWAIGDVGIGPVSSPVLAGDTLYVVAPNHGEHGWSPFAAITGEYDKNHDGGITRDEVAEAWLIQHFGWLDRDGDEVISETDWTTLGQEVINDRWGVHAIRLGGDKPEPLWSYQKNVSEIASPLVLDGVFYMVEEGILTTLDTATGELLKRGRIGDGSPKVYASPIAANGRVFVATLDGTMFVIRAAGEWEILSSVDFDDEIWATPAIVGDRIYVRTRSKLYSFGVGR